MELKLDRIKDLTRDALEMHAVLLSSIVEIPDYTLENLPSDIADKCVARGLYEFTEYRREFGGRLIFMCLKAPNGDTFFLERYRMYGKESPQGIERRDDPSYINGISETVYGRIPAGSTILDLGCGTGKYLKGINAKGLTVLAMDISGELILDNLSAPELEGINFIPGDCVDLRLFEDREIDYLTGVNIINVLYPEMVDALLEQGGRVAQKGCVFAFTLPARADMWSDYSPEMADSLKEGLNKGTASDEAVELASNKTFLGQMRVLKHIKSICREKGWNCRVFRFLDSSILSFSEFNKTLDGKHLQYKEDSLLKLLEFPIRRAAQTGEAPEGSYLVCSIGYGVEVYYGNELPPLEDLHYFSDEVDLEQLTIRSELNDSIERWNLPFEMF